MFDKQGIYDLLDSKKIKYQAVEHPAVYTIEEMDRYKVPNMHLVAKNLFLHNSNKSKYYLVTMPGHKKLDMKELGKRIGSTRLSFANEDLLPDMLGLKRGAVTPLGILNNEDKSVIAVFDQKLKGKKIGIHPLDNTATIFVAFDDVLKLVQEHGNEVILANMDGM